MLEFLTMRGHRPFGDESSSEPGLRYFHNGLLATLPSWHTCSSRFEQLFDGRKPAYMCAQLGLSELISKSGV